MNGICDFEDCNEPATGSGEAHVEVEAIGRARGFFELCPAHIKLIERMDSLVQTRRVSVFDEPEDPHRSVIG